MPLIKSGSKKAVSKNISEMVKAGHPKDQAVAAALATARRYGKADGGAVGALGEAMDKAFSSGPMEPFRKPRTGITPIPRPDPRRDAVLIAPKGSPDNRSWMQNLPSFTYDTGRTKVIPPGLMLYNYGLNPSRKHGDAIDYDPRDIMGSGHPLFQSTPVHLADGGNAQYPSEFDEVPRTPEGRLALTVNPKIDSKDPIADRVLSYGRDFSGWLNAPSAPPTIKPDKPPQQPLDLEIKRPLGPVVDSLIGHYKDIVDPWTKDESGRYIAEQPMKPNAAGKVPPAMKSPADIAIPMLGEAASWMNPVGPAGAGTMKAMALLGASKKAATSAAKKAQTFVDPLGKLSVGESQPLSKLIADLKDPAVGKQKALNTFNDPSIHLPSAEAQKPALFGYSDIESLIGEKNTAALFYGPKLPKANLEKMAKSLVKGPPETAAWEAAQALWDVASTHPHHAEALFRNLPPKIQIDVGHRLSALEGVYGESPFDFLGQNSSGPYNFFTTKTKSFPIPEGLTSNPEFQGMLKNTLNNLGVKTQENKVTALEPNLAELSAELLNSNPKDFASNLVKKFGNNPDLIAKQLNDASLLGLDEYIASGLVWDHLPPEVKPQVSKIMQKLQSVEDNAAVAEPKVGSVTGDKYPPAKIIADKLSYIHGNDTDGLAQDLFQLAKNHPEYADTVFKALPSETRTHVDAALGSLSEVSGEYPFAALRGKGGDKTPSSISGITDKDFWSQLEAAIGTPILAPGQKKLTPYQERLAAHAIPKVEGEIPSKRVPFTPPPKARGADFKTAAVHSTKTNVVFEKFKLPEYELGVHFGTPKAGWDRIKNQKSFLADDDKSLLAPRTYPVVLRANNPLRLPDLMSWSSSRIEGGLLSLHSPEFPADEVRRARFGGNFNLSSEEQIKNLRKYIESKGYDSIVYRNNVEDPGSDSYLLWKSSKEDPDHLIGAKVPWAKFKKINDPNLMTALGAIIATPAVASAVAGNKDKMNRGGMAQGGPGSHPWNVRSASHPRQPSGLINTSVPGRTDKHPMSVPKGSYIIPADIPSALGQGNTMAGSQILSKMFKAGPYDSGMTGQIKSPRMPMRRFDWMRTPRPASRLRAAAAGGAQEDIPIIAAGGEYVLHPDQVAEIGHGNIDHGHRVLDKFVLAVRKKNIETLKGLRPPKK